MNPTKTFTDDVGIFLKSNGIKPSYQRLKIYSFLLKNRVHPTVDTIYKHLYQKIPTLSKTTIYNTLNLFLEKKIIQKLVIEETETRYDVNISTHGHLKCKKCGEVFDIFFDNNFFDFSSLKNFEIHETHLYFKGFCKECSTQIKSSL